MAAYRLTAKAQSELDHVYEYSIFSFGLAKAQAYLTGLHRAFGLLSEHPRMGRDCSHLRKGLRRHEHVSHSIFYRQTKGGVLIVRVLGPGQDPTREVP